MDRFPAARMERVAAARRILAHFNGKPIDDSPAFNADGRSRNRDGAARRLIDEIDAEIARG